MVPTSESYSVTHSGSLLGSLFLFMESILIFRVVLNFFSLRGSFFLWWLTTSLLVPLWYRVYFPFVGIWPGFC